MIDLILLRTIIGHPPDSHLGMRNIFYQGNFCAECGNHLKPQRSLLPRYLCGDCQGLIKPRRNPSVLLSIITLLTTIIFFLRPVSQSRIEPKPSVSAFNATSGKPVFEESKPEEKVFCGAQTKKGTPCRRMVRPGQRCAQHRGRPTMIKPVQPD